VARVPGTGLPKGARRTRKRGERRGRAASVHKRNAIMAWSILIFMASFTVLGFFLWSWLRGQMGRGGSADASREMQRHKVSEFASPSEERALALVKAAMELRDPLEAIVYFRAGGKDPVQIVRFLASMRENDGPITGYQWLSSMDANGLLIEGVLVTTTLEGKPRNRLALLTPDDIGVWKIDFEAFARSVSPPWEEILAEDGGQGLVRVIVAKDTYYNGPFRDDTRWACYGMASPDIDEILLGYCRKDSPQEEAMQRMFPDDPQDEQAARSKKIIRATLRLTRPQGAETRQFEITRVLAEDWIVSDEPFDRVVE